MTCTVQPRIGCSYSAWSRDRCRSRNGRSLLPLATRKRKDRSSQRKFLSSFVVIQYKKIWKKTEREWGDTRVIFGTQHVRRQVQLLQQASLSLNSWDKHKPSHNSEENSQKFPVTYDLQRRFYLRRRIFSPLLYPFTYWRKLATLFLQLLLFFSLSFSSSLSALSTTRKGSFRRLL